MCMKCNTDVCSMSLSPGGRPVQCYFYCMEVKKKMLQMTVLEDTTSPALQTSTDTFTKAPAQQTITEEACNSSDVQLETVLMVVMPILGYVLGIASLAIYYKCIRNRNGDCPKVTLKSHLPQGRYAGTTEPQDAAELAISAKLMQEPAPC
ncbi:uncharacterized protein LOC110443849 [Mizuhopecten yessoensis]|uniref:uncharacterized protein LOC110443849 n=1 Tax=Mizuhopecten yessoensis TaxID=6573 RepID=UPI000B457EC6|nr:uncharacterized protein LOC110443849 [Mizuhopecten yessoensis]